MGSGCYLDKVISGKEAVVQLWFIVTDIGTSKDPAADCYLHKIKMPGMQKGEDREYLELKAKDKKTVGDVVEWSISDVEGEEPDPKDPDGDKMITTYKMSNVTYKTFGEEDPRYPMAKATITYPFEAVLSTDNWED